MKKTILFLGVLFFLLTTIPSHAQKTTKAQKESKIKTEKTYEKKSQKMEVLSPKKVLQATPKAKLIKEKVTHSPIDPITGEPRNNGNNSAKTGTYITTPKSIYRDIAFTEIPIIIEGTAKRNSEVKATITTTYEKYGQVVSKTKNMNLSTDNDGKWGAVKIYSIKVDEADDKVTHKITAVRIEDDREKDNKATVTVYSNPDEITSVKITAPKKNLYPVDDGYADGKVTSPITVRGLAIKGHTVEIRVQTSQRTAGNYNDSHYLGSRLIQDWTPVTVNAQGHWSKQINTGEPGNTGGEQFLTILVRDTSKKSEIKTRWVRR